MRTVTRFGAFTLPVAIVFGGWWLAAAGTGDAATIVSRIEITSATREQVELARWAVGRFEIAGLEPPSVEIEFHTDPSGCGGHLGYAKQGTVDVCTTLVNAMTRRALLHEMSHVWLDQHVDEPTKASFLAVRGLPSWNASSDPWRLRGYEQGAEIVSWEIGERILTPQIPHSGPKEIELAFELLTGIDRVDA